MIRRHCRSLANLSLTIAALGLTSQAFAIESSISGSIENLYKFDGSSTVHDDVYKDYSHSGAGTFSDAVNYYTPQSAFLHVAANSYSAADGNGLHASTSMRSDRATPDSTIRRENGFKGPRVFASAMVEYDDFVLSGPGTVPISVDFSGLLEGSVQATVELDGSSYDDGNLDTESNVNFSMTANGNTVVDASQYTVEHRVGANPYDFVAGGGALSSYGGSGAAIFASKRFMVTPNVPFSVAFSLSAYSAAGFDDDVAGGVLASADFGDTLSFVTDRPVFDLPAGYTVNAPSAHVLDNRFVPQAVPEPVSFAALGLGALVLLRRRR